MKKQDLKLEIGDIVYIEFDDHCTDMPKWERSDDWHHSICAVKAVGFVIMDSDAYLTIVQMIQQEHSVASQSFTIVKSCITKIRKLKAGKK